jgi:hypothetical protein
MVVRIIIFSLGITIGWVTNNVLRELEEHLKETDED